MTTPNSIPALAADSMISQETDKMDAFAKAGMRACLLGAAAAGLIAPGLLDAQISETPAKTASRPASQRKATKPTGPVVPAGYESNGNAAEVAQSEVEQRLRELYERDGRQMPDISMTPAGRQAVAPVATPAIATPATANPSNAPRMIPVSQPAAVTPQPVPTQTAPPANTNKVSSFFKKMIPHVHKNAQAQTPPVPPVPPRQLPATAQQPVVQPNQPVNQNQGPNQYNPVFISQPQQRVAPQQPVVQPQVQTQQPIVPQQPVMPRQPNPSAAARSVAFGKPAGGVDVTMPPAEDEDLDLVELPAPSPESEAAPQIMQPEMMSDDDDDEDDDDEDDAQPMPAAAPKMADDEFDPFGERQAAPEVPTEEEQNPFTGKTLDEDIAPLPAPAPAPTPAPAPAAAPTAAPAAAPTGPAELPPAEIEEPVDESTAAKMRKIIQRTDMKGLKGFCPVTLRDQRELADSRPEFVGTYRGQKFFFATKAAQDKFEKDPARYAPAAYGADVVVLTNDQDVIEGTLDYAAWYKSRLYLFSSEKNHDVFVETPEKFATPPGIE